MLCSHLLWRGTQSICSQEISVHKVISIHSLLPSAKPLLQLQPVTGFTKHRSIWSPYSLKTQVSCSPYTTLSQVSWSTVNWTSSSLSPLKKAILFFLRMEIYLSFCFLFFRVAFFNLFNFFKNNNQFLCKLWVLRTVSNTLCLCSRLFILTNYSIITESRHNASYNVYMCSLWLKSEQSFGRSLQGCWSMQTKAASRIHDINQRQKKNSSPLVAAASTKSPYWRDCPHW